MHTSQEPLIPTLDLSLHDWVGLMSSSEQTSPTQISGGDGEAAATNFAMRGRFNVTRTRHIAYAGVPLIGPDGTPASPTAAPQPPPATPPATPPMCGTPPTQRTPPLAPRTNPVPLITPRYQKKSRTNRSMELTDSFAERSSNAGELLRQHATESLTVTNGPQQYRQEVYFHTYDVYRHGRHHIHSRSVGYSSDGDLVMTREDYSEPSDVDNSVMRVRTVISAPTVLDPSARRPLTDSEMASKRKLHLRRPRYKKYPGIYTPRNKKLRNRLINDYFVYEQAMQALNLARERREDGCDDAPPPPRPSFQDLPASVLRAFDLTDDAQERELERLGAVRPAPIGRAKVEKDPDAAETRFQKLNMRLRGELQHALNSEFLTDQIEDLEVCFSAFLTQPPTAESLVYRFRDGYGRLVCHGVAAYYALVSDSRLAADGETKLTYVSLPKSRRTGARGQSLPSAPLLHVLRGHRGNAPARHPLSATSSPAHGPHPSPLSSLYSPGGVGDSVTGGEVMPSLDLNASPLLSSPPGEGGGGPPEMRLPRAGGCDGDGDAEVRGASGVGESRACGLPVLGNPTVRITEGGKLPATVDVPVYAPRLRLREFALVREGHRGDSPPERVDEDGVREQSDSEESSGSEDG